jgi:hypothetical protein
MATENFKELKNESLNRIAKTFKYEGDLNDLHKKIIQSKKTEKGNTHYWIKTLDDRIYSSKENILKLTQNKDGEEVINYGLINNLCRYDVHNKYALDVEGVGKIYPKHMYPDVCTLDRVNDCFNTEKSISKRCCGPNAIRKENWCYCKSGYGYKNSLYQKFHINTGGIKCVPLKKKTIELTRLRQQIGFKGDLDELDKKIQEGLKVNNTDGKRHFFYWGKGDDLYDVDENLAKRDLTKPDVHEFVKGICNPDISDSYKIDVEKNGEIIKIRPIDMYPVFCKDILNRPTPVPPPTPAPSTTPSSQPAQVTTASRSEPVTTTSKPVNVTTTSQQKNGTTSASQQKNGATSASQQTNGATSASQQTNGTTSASQQKNGTKFDSSGSDENKKLSTGIIIAVVTAVIIVSITVYLYMNPNALEKIKKWLSKNIQL